MGRVELGCRPNLHRGAAPVPRREAEGPPDPPFALRLLRKLAKKHNYTRPSRPGPELPEPPELPELPLTPSGLVSNVPLIARRAFILRRSDSRADSDSGSAASARVGIGSYLIGSGASYCCPMPKMDETMPPMFTS